MKKVILIETTPQDLQQPLLEAVEKKLNEFLEAYKPNQPDSYLTRQDVADLFDVNLSTIHNWCKKGKLKPLGIGNRVYFLRSDIEKSLKPLN